MTHVSGIIAEIRSIQGALAARGSADASDRLEQKLAHSVSGKISRLVHLSLADSTHLYNAINDSDCSDNARAGMSAAVDNKLEQMVEDDDAGGEPSTKNQLNVHPLTWCTPQILTALGGRSPICTKIQMLAEYMSTSLGIKKPHEQTYKWWLALLVVMHYNSVFPRYDLVHEHLLTLKAAVKDLKSKKWPRPLLPKYPVLPSDLSEDDFNAMFPEEFPVVHTIERFSLIAKGHIPLRKKKLKAYHA